MLSKAASSTIFESLVWLDLGLNLGLPDHWRTFYSLGYTAKHNTFVWFCLIWFYSISTIVGYLMPNPFLHIYSSISNNSSFTQFSSIWPIDRTLLGATTPSQSGPGSDGNEELLHILQSSSITGARPDCVISRTFVGGVLLLFRGAVGVFYSPPPADWVKSESQNGYFTLD